MAISLKLDLFVDYGINNTSYVGNIPVLKPASASSFALSVLFVWAAEMAAGCPSVARLR